MAHEEFNSQYSGQQQSPNRSLRGLLDTTAQRAGYTSRGQDPNEAMLKQAMNQQLMQMREREMRIKEQEMHMRALEMQGAQQAAAKKEVDDERDDFNAYSKALGQYAPYLRANPGERGQIDAMVSAQTGLNTKRYYEMAGVDNEEDIGQLPEQHEASFFGKEGHVQDMSLKRLQEQIDIRERKVEREWEDAKLRGSNVTQELLGTDDVVTLRHDSTLALTTMLPDIFQFDEVTLNENTGKIVQIKDPHFRAAVHDRAQFLQRLGDEQITSYNPKSTGDKVLLNESGTGPRTAAQNSDLANQFIVSRMDMDKVYHPLDDSVILKDKEDFITNFKRTAAGKRAALHIETDIRQKLAADPKAANYTPEQIDRIVVGEVEKILRSKAMQEWMNPLAKWSIYDEDPEIGFHPQPVENTAIPSNLKKKQQRKRYHYQEIPTR